MKVLFTTWAWRSHYFPMVPLGWAFLAAGHEVRVASRPGLVDDITGSGLPAVAVGPDLDFQTVFREQIGNPLERTHDATQSLSEMRRTGRLERVLRAIGVARRYADAMADDILAFAQTWRPDLVVFEPLNMAGPLVGKLLRVPTARHLWSADFTGGIGEIEAEVTAPLAARFGLQTLHLLGDVTVDPCPPSMQTPAPVRRELMRYVPYNGRAMAPTWVLEPPVRPRVCLTWGTQTAGIGQNDLFLVSQVLGALAGLDAEIVVAVTPEQRAQLTEVPANARVLDEPLALHLWVGTCDLLIHQGGSGTTMTSLLNGVPNLVLPQIMDQVFTARQIASTGAGRYVQGSEATPGVVRDTVVEMLADRRYQQAAREVGDEMRAMPPAPSVVAALEGFAQASAN
ncbi:MAG TPA: nucleotide disphospho-sugar-binding domain-containing protein [Rugosimonospora sp.]|nr:nucleotide disphospho-sugar-binding domain-containing protein [Rugosimonospora sp.]